MKLDVKIGSRVLEVIPSKKNRTWRVLFTDTIWLKIGLMIETLLNFLYKIGLWTPSSEPREKLKKSSGVSLYLCLWFLITTSKIGPIKKSGKMTSKLHKMAFAALGNRWKIYLISQNQTE